MRHSGRAQNRNRQSPGNIHNFDIRERGSNGCLSLAPVDEADLDASYSTREVVMKTPDDEDLVAFRVL